MKNNKLRFISTTLCLLGIVFAVLKNTFYQYVDNVGFLHESLFLPLSVFCLLGGLLIAVYLIIRALIYK